MEERQIMHVKILEIKKLIENKQSNWLRNMIERKSLVIIIWIL